MAKKTSSFNLEQDIYAEIEEYKNAHNLSSRNVALERMLLERRMLLMRIDLSKVNEFTPSSDSLHIQPSKNDKQKNKIKMSIKNSFDEMPE